jgi:carboxyl-terminal processing protease
LNLRAPIFRAIALAGPILFLGSLLRSQSDIPADELTQQTLKFTQVYGLLEENYVEPLDPDRAIFDGGIRGMLSALDPFSSFFDPAQFEELQQFARGKARGFGSILYVSPGKILVLQTAQGSPSWRAGLGPGDEIVEVNGTRISRLDFPSLIELLQRARSQPARLGVIRPGQVVAQDFELNPAEVETPTVDKAFVLKPGIAYLHVSAFDQKTDREITQALEQLGGASLRGLLLDLRGNRGGVLDTSITLASLFLKPDLVVLTQRGRAVPEKSFSTSPRSAHFDLPLIVLVDGNTASAAEVLGAALQEHDRALIAGEPTYGKGMVESVAALSERTGLALTTAQYFTPSGRSLQRPLPGTALAAPQASLAATANPVFRTDNGRVVAAGGGITPDVVISAPARDPWASFLDQRGIFTGFASEYLTLRGKVERSFEPDAKVLDEFRKFLGEQGIRVPEEYWTEDQDYLKLKIKAEVFNLVFGLAVGDEIETRGDPQVQKAAGLFAKVPVLLKPRPPQPASPRVKHPAAARGDLKAVGDT